MTRVPLLSPDELRALGLLARQIAHDFNNVLSSVMGYSTLLKGKLETEDPRHRYASMIERASVDAGATVERLLMFGRIWTLPASPIPVDLDPLQEEIVHIAEAGPGGIRVDVDCTRVEEKHRVRVDLRHLQRGIEALTHNACEAQPGAEKPHIGLRFALVPSDDASVKHAQGASGHLLRIEVTDHGQGMTPEVIAEAARPGFTTRQEARRQGLGIALAHGLAHSHGGLLEIDTEEGHGTTARLWLPVS